MMAARLERGPTTPARVADEREEERRRIARELHDGPAQGLAAALFGVDLAVASLDRAPAEARDELLHARGLLREALDDLRGLMTGLRPRLLEERGLLAALRSLAGTTPLWGPVVSIEARGIAEGQRMPADVELALYRIAQEAVSNARRHGAAARVRVELVRERDLVRLAVVDDGHGFPPQHLRPAQGHGEGVPGMHERAALLGGDLTIESAPGAGTRVVATAPLPQHRQSVSDVQ